MLKKKIVARNKPYLCSDGDKKLLAEHKKHLPDNQLNGNKSITNGDIKNLKLTEA